MKYARLERERRFLLCAEFQPAEKVRTVEDRYLLGTRLRLRRVAGPDGIVLKLGQQEDVEPGIKRVTTIYLDDAEYLVLASLPADAVTKTRATVRDNGVTWAIDTYPDGTRIAETEDEIDELPSWVGEEVTGDPKWSGAALASRCA